MITITSVEAQNRFGELIDRAQRGPVQVTCRGRTVAGGLPGRDSVSPRLPSRGGLLLCRTAQGDLHGLDLE